MNLNDSVETLSCINKKYSSKLEKLGIFTIKDLITYFPRAYSDTSDVLSISELLNQLDFTEKYTVKASVQEFKNIHLRSRKTIQSLILQDLNNSNITIEAVFFNQPFLSRIFKLNKLFLISGKLSLKGKKLQFYPTEYEEFKDTEENSHLGRISPEYKLTQGVSKKWLRNRIKTVLEMISADELSLEKEIPEGFSYPAIVDSLNQVHFPVNEDNKISAVKTLSELELVDLHLRVQSQRKKKKINPVELQKKDLTQEFTTLLPFRLTTDQLKVIKNINKLLEKGLLNMLLQGDVGSGKTVIAQYLSYLSYKNNLQSVVLCPTTVLARQHFKNFSKMFKDQGIKISLAIGSEKEVEPGNIVIGTTAVLARQKDLLNNIGCVIVDEQHRFGVRQRDELLTPLKLTLGKKTPHFLNMTATPIPRTIAETLFSDVQVQTIKLKPKGRLPIKSFVVPENKRKDAEIWIENLVKNEKQQVYWICPLVEESEILEAKSAKQLFNKLTLRYPNLNLGLLHGKLKDKEKDKIMTKFVSAEIDILVSTTVIEVGIDVSNATVILIENAERFGLAQLHQLRGRVGRGDKQSYCFLFQDKEASEQAQERLTFLSKHSDGLEIAEYDLHLRGPGEVYGVRQSGIPKLKIAKLDDLDMIKRTRIKAEKLLENGVQNINLFK